MEVNLLKGLNKNENILCGEDITSKKPRLERLFVFSFGWFTLLFVFPTQYIFHTPMVRYSLFVLNVPLDTNHPTNLG